MEKAAKRHPRIQVPLEKARILRLIQKPQLALNELDKAPEALKVTANFQLEYAKNLAQAKNGDEAISKALSILDHNPNHLNTLQFISERLLHKRAFDHALPFLMQICTLDPYAPENWEKLGSVYYDMDNLEKAKESYEKAITLNPNFDRAIANLGLVEYQRKETQQAIFLLQKAIQLNPKHPGYLLNLGSILHKENNLLAAENCFKKAISLKANFSEAWSNLANVLKDQRKILAALNAFQKAIQISPDTLHFQSNYLLTLNYCDAFNGSHIIKQHIKINDLFPDYPTPSIKIEANARIRIAYLSSDFHFHSISNFIIPILKTHDKAKFEIFCYYSGNKNDEITEKIKKASEHWRSIARLTDDEASRMIRHDDIHILVDLSGHMAHNRLTLLAKKPAPIQISWLGYPTLTGCNAFDYHFTDRIATPDNNFIKDNKLKTYPFHLPQGYHCYHPIDQTPPPQRDELYADKIVFGSFNNICKLSDTIVKIWARVLREVENSILIIKSNVHENKEVITPLLDIFKAQNIESERIIFLPKVRSYYKHLQCYQHIDIALDSFPYNGTTTTCESLWMGVPVITLCKDAPASRVSASLLTQLGKKEWIAETSESYIQKALICTQSFPQWRQERKRLRERLKKSPLGNPKILTHHVEKAFLKMISSKTTKVSPENK